MTAIWPPLTVRKTDTPSSAAMSSGKVGTPGAISAGSAQKLMKKRVPTPGKTPMLTTPENQQRPPAMTRSLEEP